jgi:hypothetical protein
LLESPASQNSRAASQNASTARQQLPEADRRSLGPLFVINQVPVIFGSGRPFFATGALAEPLLLENPTTIVAGDRVTHLVYDVRR